MPGSDEMGNVGDFDAPSKFRMAGDAVQKYDE